YDDRGLLTSDTDCSGSETRYEWHPRGWLLREILPDGRHTDYEHDAAGRVLTRRQPDRPVERIEWDNNGLPVAYTGPDNRRYAREYDASGQLVLTRNPAGQTVRLESDAQGRAVRLINENGEATAFRYGADGLLLAETASDGVVTGYSYDAAGRLREKVFAQGHRQAIRWGFDYTAAGLPSARSTPDGQTRFGYDACGRLITAARYPALSTGGFAQHGEDGLRLTRDLLGRVTGEQGEEGAMARAYDALGNLTALTLPDGRTLRQHYYGSGHLTAIALDEDIISEFTRDRLHREDSRTQGRLTTYTTYNRRGFPAAQDTYRDGLRQPSTPQWAWRRSWDLAGRLKTEKAGEMTSRYRSWRYGEDDRLEEQSGSLPGNRQWEWDAAGNPLDAGTNAGGPPAQSGTPRRDTPGHAGTPGNDDLPEMWRNLYAAHGLTGEGSAPEAGVTGEPGRRYVAHNRVTRLGEVEWRYDVHGRVIGKREPGRHLALEWNGEHRLAKVTVTPDRPAMPQTVVQFRYDALGRRTEKQVHYVSRNRSWHPVVPLPASYRVRFVWDGLRMVQEIRWDGSTTYVYRDTDSYVPLARIDTPDRAREYTRIYWYHTRPDGTPEQLSDSNGEEVWRIVNDAWGRVDTAWGEINSAAVREDNLRMQGQYLDRETGLHYNLFRYYDADSMHFISPDPIGLAGGLNLYAYAPDPVNWADPWGLKTCPVREVNSTRIHGIGQKDKTPGHNQFSEVIANKLAMSGKFKDIYLNRSYSFANGKGISGRRPDIMAVDVNGRVHSIELASKTDMGRKLPTLTSRNETAMGNLPVSKQGEILVFEHPYSAFDMKSMLDDLISSI
ncbi:RHS repeat-associated core domain-containing protein, partial [Candidatus Pantoea multigeneris]